MTYDWGKILTQQPEMPEFYENIDRRFWKAAWFGHQRGEEPFSRGDWRDPGGQSAKGPVPLIRRSFGAAWC